MSETLRKIAEALVYADETVGLARETVFAKQRVESKITDTDLDRVVEVTGSRSQWAQVWARQRGVLGLEADLVEDARRWLAEH